MKTARRILEGDLDEAETGAQRTLELGHRAGQYTEAFIFFSEQMLEIRRWQDRNDFILDFIPGSPIAFNLPRGLGPKAYGYPAASPFNGQSLYSCSGTVVQDTVGGSTNQGAGLQHDRRLVGSAAGRPAAASTR